MNALYLDISNKQTIAFALQTVSEVLPAPGCRLQLFFPLIVCVYLEIPLDGKTSLVFSGF